MAQSSYLSLDGAARRAFWERLRVTSESDACWEWQGAKVKGYGKLELRAEGKRKSLTATRIMFALLHGSEVPEGLLLMHRCDNPPCCNPAHLRLGTQAENVADMCAKDRQNIRRKLWLAKKAAAATAA